MNLMPYWAELQKSKLHSAKYRGSGRRSKEEETMETFRLTNKKRSQPKTLYWNMVFIKCVFLNIE